ncbi:MAG: response regulator [Anaerolineales bacterium]|nr:response regulator [Anaerolineales bacterium]
MAKILIVDDDLETIKLLESIVKMDGHEPFAIHESRNALKAVETIMPDLVLLDIMMAEINGIAICKLIRSDPKISHTKVIMVSALNDDGTKRDAANAGANQFITKPILPRIFLSQIKDVLEQ